MIREAFEFLGAVLLGEFVHVLRKSGVDELHIQFVDAGDLRHAVTPQVIPEPRDSCRRRILFELIECRPLLPHWHAQEFVDGLFELRGEPSVQCFEYFRMRSRADTGDQSFQHRGTWQCDTFRKQETFRSPEQLSRQFTPWLRKRGFLDHSPRSLSATKNPLAQGKFSW